MSNEVLLWGVKDGMVGSYHASWSSAQRQFRYLMRQGKSPEMFTITQDRLRQWAAAADEQAGKRVDVVDVVVADEDLS